MQASPALLLILLLIGCAARPAQLPVAEIPPLPTPLPTATPTPTNTPTSEPTKAPTATSTPPASATPLPTNTATATLLPTATSEPAPIELAFVGDVMLARALGDQIRWSNIAYPFEHVAEVLNSADFAVANLESALGDIGYPAPKAYTFQAPPDAAKSISLGGFDLVSLANNHALDYGIESLSQGIDLLAVEEVASVGAGMNEAAARAPYLVTIGGVQLAFLSYVHVPIESSGFDTESWRAIGESPGVAWAEPEVIAADVAEIRPKADHIIVLLHSGNEGVRAPSEAQRDAAYAAIDAGATAVVSHHAHILQGIEQRGNGVIFWGLGNFAFDFNLTLQRSAILHLSVTQQAIDSWWFTPITIQTDGQPRLAESAEATRIIEVIMSEE